MTKAAVFRLTIIAVVPIGLLLYFLAFPPTEPIATANGRYTNPCCGSLVLRDGRITTSDNQFVRYVVEHDKRGRYIVPEGYVGASKRGIVIRRAGNPLKIYLEPSQPPQHIELLDDATGEAFTFSRPNGS